jgi:L-threonylcarbamoyladenylate synthase
MPILPANEKTIAEAARIIRGGGVAAFPTETVYGLGANAYDAQAVAKIFALKGRPSDNPLIVHIAETGDLGKISKKLENKKTRKQEEIASSRSLLAMANALAKKFWPGPLTLVLPRNKKIPYEVTAGLETVAVRCPAHSVARDLIRAAGVPIAAPSANLSGRPSPTSAKHVAEDFGEELFILDGGEAEVGLESTVLDLTVDPPVILRRGAVTLEMLKEIIPDVAYAEKFSGAVKSPGQKYAHYAPRAPLFLARGSGEDMVQSIQRFILSRKNLKVGVLTVNEHADRYPRAFAVISLGPRRDLKLIARNLFTMLRKFDKLNVDVIISETFPKTDIGSAIMERLERASNHE